MHRHGNLKTIKEIAADIGRGRSFVFEAKKAMLAQGVLWPCNMFSTESFLAWVAINNFRSRGGRRYLKQSTN